MESGAPALGSVQAAPSAVLESGERTCSLCLEEPSLRGIHRSARVLPSAGMGAWDK